MDSYNIYSVGQDGDVQLRYKLDFGDAGMPAGALHDADNYNRYAERFAIVHTVFETEQYLFIEYSIGSNIETNRINHAVFDKFENKIIAHQSGKEGLTSGKYPNITFWPKYVDDQGRLICTHPARDFVDGEVLQGIKKEDNLIVSVIKPH